MSVFGAIYFITVLAGDRTPTILYKVGRGPSISRGFDLSQD